MLPLNDWLIFISELEGAVGVPFLIGGIALMVFGGRLSRVSVMLAYAVIGAALTAWLLGPQDVAWWAVVAGAAVPALISYWTVTQAVPILGGSIMGGMTMFAFGGMGFSPSALCGIGLFALIAFSAFSYLHREHVIIGVTAVLGSVLVVSGMAVWVSAFPGLYGHLRAMALESMFVAPFFLLVPTVASCLYQVGNMHRRMLG